MQQSALEESEAYFRALVDTAPVMLWTTDADGRVTYLSERLEDVAFAEDIGVWYSDAPFDAYQLNPQMASHLDLASVADVPLRDVLAAVGHDDGDRLGAAIATALRGGAPLDIELTNKAGTRWLRAIGWCGVNAPAGRPYGAPGR
jgi:PAS domain-containing protein